MLRWILIHSWLSTTGWRFLRIALHRATFFCYESQHLGQGYSSSLPCRKVRSFLSSSRSLGDDIQPAGPSDSRAGLFAVGAPLRASVAVRIVPRGRKGGGQLPFQAHQKSSLQPEKTMPSFSTLDDRFGGKTLIRLLPLLLALAVTAPVLLAQEWDHWDKMNGRDKVHDPTGAWLVRFHIPDDPILNREFFLIVFHKGGTLTQNIQGESGFDPSAVPLPPTDPNYNNNVISTPSSGVWQKTGWNTFAGTLLDIEYHNAFNPALNLPPNVSVFQFTKQQFTGRLTESGDQMILSVRLTHFDSDGKQIDGIQSYPANGVRIPLEILPSSANTLPIPSVPN
jgi:hypothetical protein